MTMVISIYLVMNQLHIFWADLQKFNFSAKCTEVGVGWLKTSSAETHQLICAAKSKQFLSLHVIDLCFVLILVPVKLSLWIYTLSFITCKQEWKFSRSSVSSDSYLQQSFISTVCKSDSKSVKLKPFLISNFSYRINLLSHL